MYFLLNFRYPPGCSMIPIMIPMSTGSVMLQARPILSSQKFFLELKGLCILVPGTHHMAVPNITSSAQGSSTFAAHFSLPETPCPPITQGQAPRCGGSISRCSMSPWQPCSTSAWWTHS